MGEVLKSQMGYPSPCGGGGSLVLTGAGGVPQSQVEYPFPGRTGVPFPKTEQQSKYLIRGGRYASCVNAGGLSCFQIISYPNNIIDWYMVVVIKSNKQIT